MPPRLVAEPESLQVAGSLLSPPPLLPANAVASKTTGASACRVKVSEWMLATYGCASVWVLETKTANTSRVPSKTSGSSRTLVVAMVPQPEPVYSRGMSAAAGPSFAPRRSSMRESDAARERGLS